MTSELLPAPQPLTVVVALDTKAAIKMGLCPRVETRVPKYQIKSKEKEEEKREITQISFIHQAGPPSYSPFFFPW